MYIQYTFVHFAILLIRQVSRAVPLPVTISFAVEALRFRLEFSFRFLHGSDNLLVILLEVPCRGKLPTTNTYGTGAPCLCGEGAEGARRADRGEHAGSLPRFGPRWTRKTLLLLRLY